MLGQSVVALCQVQVTQRLSQSFGVAGLADVVLGGLLVALQQGYQSLVSLCLCATVSGLGCLCQIALGLVVVALGIGQSSEVVIGTSVLWIQACGGLQNILFLSVGVGNAGGIDQLFEA